MDKSTHSLSSCNEEVSYSPLLHGLPDDIALFCLARVPRKYHTVLKCVSKRWRDLVCSEEWREYRQKHDLGESWIYALCRDKRNDQLRLCMLDPTPSTGRQAYWDFVPDLPPRCVKRRGMGFEVIGKKLYLLGGSSWAELAVEVFCYDVSRNTWSELASMPTPRCYFGCSAVDEMIFAIGGCGLEPSVQHSWDTYNSRTNTWESHSDPNIILDIAESLVMNGEIYTRSVTSPIPPHVYLAMHNPSSGKWQQPDANMALGWQGPAVVADDNLYVLDQISGSKLMMWHKDSKEWVTVCRLSPFLTRPPCQMTGTRRNIFIVGRELSTIVLDISNFSNSHGVVTSSSVPIISATDYDILSCKCVSI